MKKLMSKIKRQWRKIKYLDKTQLSYFVVTGFIGAFCLFTAGTYSYFTIIKDLNAATITIAKLKYNLSSTTSGYSEGNISVPAGETKVVDLTLESLNNIETKYALNYSTSESGIEVYYSENLRNNMMGLIGPVGSDITMRVVIVNSGTTAANVNLTATGGYVKNTLTTNITQGYFEADIVVRTVLLDENAENAILEQNFPTKDGEYVYFRTSCSEDVTPSWDNENWKLNLGEISGQIACDVYFKKMAYDVEIYIGLEKKDGSFVLSTEVPSASAYTFNRTECNNSATATWDETARELVLANTTSKTICVGYFKEN